MWRCRKCGGKVVAELHVECTTECEIDEDVCVDTVQEIAIDLESEPEVYITSCYCTECYNSTENADIEELKQIAKWED